MTTVAIYARISKDRYGAGVSVENQLRAIREYVQKQGWTIGETFSDNDISAYTGKTRPGFEALLASDWTEVVCWHQDRLLRVSKDLERVLDCGLIVHQVIAGSFDLKTTQGRAMARTVTAWSTHEIEQKSERQRLKNKGDVQSGKYIGRLKTFGQMIDGTLIPDEAQAVREAARDLATREATFYGIANRWNDAGFRTPVQGDKGHGGNLWHANSVRTFFTAPRLMGFQEYEGVRYPIKDWTPLLDEETWERVQSLIDSNKRGPSGMTFAEPKNLLSGILTCYECGKHLTTSSRANGQGRIYRCLTGRHTTVKMTDVDEAVKDDALRLLSRREDSEGELEEIRQKIAAVSHQLRVKEVEHEDWLQEALTARLKAGMIATAQEAYESEVEALRSELVTLQAQSATDLFSEYGTGWDEAPLLKRRDLLAGIYSEIVLHKGERGKHFSIDRLTFKYTPFALELMERYLADETAGMQDFI